MKKNMGRIIFQTLLGLLLLCVALPGACPAKGGAVQLPGGMSITLPDNWQVQPEEKGTPVLVAVGHDEKGEAFGMVMINQMVLPSGEEPLTQDKLPDLNAEEKAAFLAEMENNFRNEFSVKDSPFKLKEIFDASIKNINGFHAASITASLDAGGNGVILEADIIMFPDRAIQLQAWCSEVQYSARGQEVRNIISSFVAGGK